MDHLQPLVAGADLAVTADLGTAGELFLLCSAEVEKPQGHPAGAVRQDDHQHGSASAHDGGVFDLAFDLHAGARVQAADGVDPGPVFIPQR